MTGLEVERWGIFEETVEGSPVAVEFRHAGGDTAYVESFAGADGRQVLRFMPDLEGEWRYELAGQAAGFTCTPASQHNHGPVRRVGEQLRWADGSAYNPLTTTWIDRPDAADRWTEACRAIAASPFDRVRIQARPGELAKLDQRVRDLLAARAGAEVVIFGADGNGPDLADDQYVRELVLRLAAYRNVTWCVGSQSGRDWRPVAELVAEYDSGRHLIAVHAAPADIDPGPPWFTHLSVPLENLRGVSALRRNYRKPIHVGDCGFEGNAAEPAASLTGPELLTRIWEGTIRGAHVAHGEWYVDAEGGPWSGGGPRPTGAVAQRLRLLRRVLDELPAEAEPIEDYRDAPTLAVPGSYYLQYLGEHRFPERTFTVPAGVYQVEVLDAWNQTVRRYTEEVADTLTVRLPGTQYQAVQIRRVD
jgi:hypothetical protein